MFYTLGDFRHFGSFSNNESKHVRCTMRVHSGWVLLCNKRLYTIDVLSLLHNHHNLELAFYEDLIQVRQTF